MKNQLFCCVPLGVSFSILNLKETMLIYYYNNNYNIIVVSSLNAIYFNENTRIMYIRSSWASFDIFSLANKLNCFFFSLEHYFIKKLKFAGKSFRVEKKDFIRVEQKKRMKVVIFNKKFGHSFPTWIFFKNLKKKHLKKTKLFFLSSNLDKLILTLKKIIKIRKWNTYTQRGLRLYKQKIWKKPGKKSSFT